LDRLIVRATEATHRIALVGFTGLVVIALLTFYDGAARYLDLPRVSGFADFGELLFPIVIASCFPALLIRQKNLTIRVLGRLVGDGAARWANVGAAVAVLIFFLLLGHAVCADDPRLPFGWADHRNHRDPDSAFLDDRHVDTVALRSHPASRRALATARPVTTTGGP
jgi:hypothetical protein